MSEKGAKGNGEFPGAAVQQASGRGALDDVRVVECAQFISGPYCAKLLADLGAEVIKVEQPGSGDRARNTGPFLNDIPHPDHSGLFLYLNTNKLSITLDVHSVTGRRLLQELLREADILVEDSSPSLAKALGIDYESLARINPKLIVTSITPFGQTGPYRDYKATDLTTCYAGGLAWNTPGRVQNAAEQSPLRPGGRQTAFVAGATAAMATLFALHNQRATGQGQHVDISAQESIASFVRMEIAYYTHDPQGLYSRFASRQLPPSAVGYLPCKDGYIVNGCREEYQWRRFFQVIAGSDREKEAKLMSFFQGQTLSSASVVQKWDVVRPVIVDWTMDHTRDEIFAIALANDFPVAPSNTVDRLFASPQLAERGCFQEIDHPVAGRLTYPATPLRLSATPCRVRRPAPLLGEHNVEVFCTRLGYSRHDLVRLRECGVI